MPAIDPIALDARLIRCPSVTPKDEGALDVLRRAVEPLGFACHRLRFAGRRHAATSTISMRGSARGGPNFCFAGHTDVVPPGDPAGWSVDPFAGEIIDGQLYGRGAADMKGAIAAFIAAAARFLGERGKRLRRLDQPAHHRRRGRPGGQRHRPRCWTGWRSTARARRLRGRRADQRDAARRHGQDRPARQHEHGADRRGRAGPRRLPAPRRQSRPTAWCGCWPTLTAEPLDAGTEHFQPSSLQVTTIDVGNPATNVIPARATRRLQHPLQRPSHARRRADGVGRSGALDAGRRQLRARRPASSGESFLTPPGALSELVSGCGRAR